MLQKLLTKSLDLKIPSRRVNLLLRTPIQTDACHQCGFRLYSKEVPVLRNYCERTLFGGNDIFCMKTRYYASQVDAQKKNVSVESTNEKTTLTDSKKINVKLKPSEVKRLLSLAEPEKWTLTGKRVYVGFT